MLFEERREYRTNKEIENLIDEIWNKFPHKYVSRSHVIRCAIIQLHKKEVNDGEKKNL
tara:strand:+ start:235 stop:408 length:174 start_codon:yes stop_codon:yes gene_type:complete